MHSNLVSLNSFIFRAIMLRFSVQYLGDFVVILSRLPFATVSIPDKQVQSTPDNLNLQGKSKKGSSYREFADNSRE